MAVDTELLHRSLAMPERDRAQLAHQLLVSLEDSDEDADDEVVKQAWAVERDRRADQVDCGEAVMQDRNMVPIRLAGREPVATAAG
jgi:hypothetical protein